jgi:hypothetical protein
VSIRHLPALAVVALVATMVVVPAGLAKDGDLRVPGICTAGSTAKLKLSHEDAAIEVEFEVDQNRNGVPWRVTLRRNGTLVAATTAVTRGPSGSFSVRRVIANAPGADRVVAAATSPTGERCTARAAF